MSADTLYFVAAVFPTHDGADFALARLKTAQVARGNVALLTCDKAGRVRIKETHDWGMGKSALLGGLAAVVVPGIGVVAGLLGGALLAKLIDAGFPDAALRKLGAELAPGTSGLAILIDSTQQSIAETVLRQAGGNVLGTGVRADFAEQFERSLPIGDEDDAAAKTPCTEGAR
jgi:uncharacterized membrane protein